MADIFPQLKSAILEVLGEGCQVLPVDPVYRPIMLILRVSNYVVGFAELEFSRRKSLETADEEFRKLYADHASEWASEDLALVICQTQPQSLPDEIINRWEFDPYFCRRFILDLSSQLDHQLRRLPFMPLPLGSEVSESRPPGALDFLLSNGVSRELGKSLVKPHHKSEHTILAECLGGTMGDPIWRGSMQRSVVNIPEEGREYTRLTSLRIGNFRAYKRTQEFDLDADVVVFSGPNGIGKTSLFDAIDFACTGGIARYEKLPRYKKGGMQKICANLDSDGAKSFVAMDIKQGGVDNSIVRFVNSAAKSKSGHDTHDRKGLLQLLTGSSETIPGLRVDNLIDLFRASHSYAQEYHSLTPDSFKKDSSFSQETVSRMLAFQDYVEAKSKVDRVLAHIDTQSKRDQSDIGNLEQERESLTREIAIATESDDSTGPPVDSLRQRALELLNQVRKSRLIQDREFTQHPDELLLELQSCLEEAISARDHQLIRLTELHELHSQNDDNRNALERLSRELEEKQKKKLAAEQELGNRRDESEHLKQAREKANQQLSRLEEDRTELNWLTREVSEYVSLQARAQSLQKSIEALELELRELHEQLAHVEERKKSVVQLKDSLSTEIQSLVHEIQDLVSLTQELLRYKEYEGRDAHLKKEIDRTDQEVSGMKTLILKSTRSVKELESESEHLQNSVESLQLQASEKQKALDNIERWVEDATCPVCGVNHGNADELHRRFEEQRGKRSGALEKALDALNSSRKSLGEMRTHVDVQRIQLEELQESRTALSKETEELQKLMANSQSLAVGLGFAGVDKIDDSLVQKRIKASEEELEGLHGRRSSADLQLNQLSTEMDDGIRRKGTAETTRTDLSADLALLKLEMERIEGPARAAKRDIHHDVERFQTEKDTLSAKADTIAVEISERKRECEQLKAKQITWDLASEQEEENFELLIQRIGELASKEKSLRSSIREYQLLVEEAGLEKGAQHERIEQEEQLVKSARGALMSFRDKAVDLRVALDATRSSAIVAQSKNKLERVEASLKELQERCETLQSWRSFFSKVGDDVDAVRQGSVTNYIRVFGPLASNIQARLRSVYRFGDIELSSESGNIRVRVGRADSKEKYYPSDYFSESQMQIAMLSLFLSAALTQNWSRFAPILLDDPVEHFDDLNCYSLLDLIKSITTSGDTGRQLLISTCDDRLFRLMRHRFSASGLKVIYHRFESIGSDGPEVTQLYS